MFNPNSKWPHKLGRKQIVLLYTMKHLNELMEKGFIQGPTKFTLHKKGEDALSELPEGWKPDKSEFHWALKGLGVIK